MSSSTYSSTPQTIVALLSAAGLPYDTGPSTSASHSPSTRLTSTTPVVNATDAASHRTTAAQRGLATGAAAGIGVGATLAVVLLVACVGLVLHRRRRRRRRRQQAVAVAEKRGSHAEDEVEGRRVKAEKDGMGVLEMPREVPAPLEAGGMGRAELAGRWVGVEVEGKWAGAELDGGWRPAEVEGKRKDG